MSPLTTLSHCTTMLLSVALPAGGQTTARRNAWAGMSASAASGRDRWQAEAALDAAELRAPLRAVRRSAGS